MTWSRKDIISEIKESCFDIDINLPYWELRRQFNQVRYTKGYLASGSFSFAHQQSNTIPKDCTKGEVKE